MQKIKILYFHSAGFIAGAEKSLLMIADNINNSRFEIIFVCPSGKFTDELKKRNIKVYNLEFPRLRSFKGVISILRDLHRIVENNNVSLIHGNDLRTNIYATLTGWRAGLPFVWHERNLIYNEFIDTERWLAFLPDAVFCNGSVIGERFKYFGRRLKKVKIIFTGIDVDLYKPIFDTFALKSEFGIKSGEVIFMMAGRIAVGKGHDDFLKAAALNYRKNPNTKYIIVGGAMNEDDIRTESSLKQLCKDLNMEDRVIFTGFRMDMEKMMSLADVFVLASHAEPFGRALQEAMASEKPIIATNTGGTPEIMEDGVTGIMVPTQDHDAIFAAMDKFSIDADLRIRMGVKGRERAKAKLDIKVCIKILENEYEDLLKR